MTPLFHKLNCRDQRELVVINAPPSFEAELAALDGVQILRDTEATGSIDFILAFVQRLDEIERITASIVAKAPGDALVWFAYPKATSKQYQCAFNRDTGWTALGAAGFEGVRQVAIDVDWSALRFRRVAYIKTMIRDPKRRITEPS